MSVLVNDPDFTLYVGDVLEQLRELPDESVHCVVTSPPYWGLRDYSTDGQIGLEATPDLFVAAMVEVFREVRRVLRADGTCWVNLGDSYTATHHGKGGESKSEKFNDPGDAWRDNVVNQRRERGIPEGLKPKDLVGIPWRVAFALQADGWYLRSDIVWSKPNPMPESVTDRPTKAHEYVFLLTKGPRYFFDQEAVRESAGENTHPRGKGIGAKNAGTEFGQGIKHNEDYARAINGIVVTSRNVRSVWEIATQPYPEAHFATFPEALPERCIKAGTSERGCCGVCEAPYVRTTEVDYEKHRPSGGKTSRVERGNKVHDDGFGSWGTFGTNLRKNVTTTGWEPSCSCNEWRRLEDAEPQFGTPPIRPCTVLDPFMGSGTTALVARRLGRRSIGIELNPDYAALCARRLQQLSLFAGEPA